MNWTRPIIACYILSLAQVIQALEYNKRIALTYDDAPLPDTYLSGAERANLLIKGLEKTGVKQAAFFITTQGIKSPEALARIQSYAKAGHVIANHSHTHPWLRNISAEEYLADIDRAEETLSLFENRRPWFRYPFLNEAPDKFKRDLVRKGLKERHLFNGYVTIDTFDWYLNSLFQKELESGNEVCLDALADLYVNMMVDAANFYEKIGRDLLNRSAAQTLLLHENDIAALFAGKLVKALKEDGWQIITADEAYKDPIAQLEPDTLYLGQGHLAALAYLNGKTSAELSHYATNEGAIKQAFVNKVLKATSCHKTATK